jgi:hypothetical protein
LEFFGSPNPIVSFFRIAPEPASSTDKPLTRRKILSDIAKLFDPIGWLAPVVITAKIMMQDLCKLDIGWDDAVPSQLQESWIKYKTDLKTLEELKIPRCIQPKSHNRIALIGFCDASEKAYAAVVYLAVYPVDLSPPLISLITSKTRVAPIKPVSLPRLELCGAVLLSQLMESVQEAQRLVYDHVSAWTDSTVTLAWIQSHPRRWNRFVANRVTEIQDRVPSSSWGHVAGLENPADCPSRGMEPSSLINSHLWWNGPQWLQNGIPYPGKFNSDKISEINNKMIEGEERRENVCHRLSINSFHSILTQYSSLMKLQRVISWIYRFVNNTQSKIRARKFKEQSCKSERGSGVDSPSQECRLEPGRLDSSSVPTQGPLQPKELQHSMTWLIKITQLHSFYQEIQSLTDSNPLNKKSSILSLNPFLDHHGVLRVGGRLTKSELSFDQRHPILIPRSSRFTELLILHEHIRLFHAGPQLLQNSLQSQYWIIRNRDAVRNQLRKCVRCTKLKAETLQQMMGDLPTYRVTPARAFLRCGVDYAGPFLLRPCSPRSKITVKAYIALFVCCTTRAIHLELVSDLTSEAFIAALRRFVARRGCPKDMYSDCGTNFVGANRELKELMTLCNSNSHNEKVSNNLSRDGIHWHFNPPGAPHFGGLWEAGVKSVKYHLKRVMGTTRLSFEEMYTTLVQIEAALNSRPITPESSDPNDLGALTPGHFLIGCPLTAAPDPDSTDVKSNRLSRWQLLQQMFQSFWTRWSKEYITRMQQRPKWMSIRASIKIGDLVIIKDDRFPPLSWRMGRVLDVFPGDDGIIRVVSLKTASGEIKRPITKLCLLPVNDEPNPTDQFEVSLQGEGNVQALKKLISPKPLKLSKTQKASNSQTFNGSALRRSPRVLQQKNLPLHST